MVYKYEFGDMVWGKIKSYPWWPGQVFNEMFAVSDMHETKIDGHILVAFFGDGSYAWLDPQDLVPFDTHYVEKSKQTNARGFVKAVEEAEHEISRRAAVGLLCRCRNPSSFRQLTAKGFLTVDVCGYRPGGLYTIKQVKSARAEFQSVEMLNFTKQLGLMPFKNFQRNVHWIKNVAKVLAFLRVVFEDYDVTYIEAFGAQPSCPFNSKLVKVPSKFEGSEETNIGALKVHHASPVDSRFLFWQDKEASLKESVDINTSVCRSKMRVGHAMVKDQQKGQKDLYKEKGKVDVLRASYSSQRQQGFLSSSVKKSSIRGGNLVLQKIDALLPEKTEFLCQRERNFNFGCVKKRSMLKGSGLVDARTDYDLNCANLVNRSQNLEQNQSRLSNYLGTQHVQVDGGTATHSNSRLWREVLVTGSDAVDKRQKELRRTHEYLTTEKVVVANKIRKTKQESKLESEMEHLHEHLEITHNEALCRPEICANIRWEVSQSDAEKISFEELKNLSELMSLSTKKKIRKEKSLKSQGTNAKDIDVTMGEKPTKSSLEKPETLKRVAKPSVLLIQFPPQSILPSVSELKARFARFGPFEHPPRVFWKSSTCRVIFKYESDAQVARRYAVQKASLFGDVKVLYDVEVLQVPAPALPKSSKQSLEATSSKIPQLTSISTSYSTESRSTAPGKQHLPAVHSKSCLKNAQADEEFFTKGVGGNLHVNFMCSGDGNHGDEQPAVNRVVQSDYHPNITSSSSQGTHDDNENNLKKVVLPLPPWLPHSYWISNLDLQIC